MEDSKTVTPATSDGLKQESVRSTSLPDSLTTITPHLPGKISTRQFIGMAFGSSIGAGLLVASGIALQRGGPGSLVLAFMLLGPFVWHTMCALAELSASFPARGSFYEYAFRFISQSWGFAMGWNYVLNWCLIMPFELTVIMILIEYWYPEAHGARVLLAVAVGLIAALCTIQYFGPKIYAEVEHACGYIKVSVLTAFMVTAFVKTGQAGDHGFDNYLNGAAFLNGFPGFLAVLVSTGLAYGGVESLGLAVKESAQPRRVLALSTWIVAVRIFFLYVMAPFCLGLILNPVQLRMDEFQGRELISPFVAAVRVNNIPYMDSIINGILVLCVFSMANAATFAGSRALAAMGDEGLGAAYCARLSGRRQIPLRALGVIAVFSCLVFITAAPNGHSIFGWLMSLASVANYFIWITINWCLIRVRHAMRQQGRNVQELQWRAPCGEWGSCAAIIAFIAVMICQIVSAILPPVLQSENGKSRCGLAFQGLLGFIIFGSFYLGHQIYVTYQGGRSWRERFLIPLDQITLPELDDVVSSAGSGEVGERREQPVENP
ncbi:unnamed protein product [Discula destructiva]